MSFNWKIPAVAAGGAFLLSFLIGLMGTVRFGVVTMRALVWAVVFAVISFGVDLLLRKFLPELYSGQTHGPDEDGQTVDITLEEENPIGAEIPEMDEDPASGPGEDEAAGSILTETGPVSAGGESEDEREFGQLAEVEEPDMVDEVSSEDGTAEGEFSDFQSFEGAFDTPERIDQPGKPQAASIDVLGIDEDPETVAKAVRTFMKKDQEG